ncbi:hypothetical protein [Chelatococcus reniformis]|uniref:Uncharacterized protein n=1 Tax=Chelatococcus reniformis TaxID=1494448 RepID=A0A916UDJ5_9HYPH|nr:hypothetical protein [Chelatococcus reniformis]GGC68344.1 hypothetical protein GCM10010994_28650 [Chelatococcus reniformis]
MFGFKNSDLNEESRALLGLIETYLGEENAYQMATTEADLCMVALRDAPALPLPDALFERDGDHKLGLFGLYQSGQNRPVFSDSTAEALRKIPRRKSVTYPMPPEMLNPGEEEASISRKEPWPEAQARADEIVAAYDAHKKALGSRPEAVALEAARAARDGLEERHDEARQTIVDAKATNVFSLYLKAAVVWYLYDYDTEGMEADTRGGDDSFDHRLMLSIALSIISIVGSVVNFNPLEADNA